MMAVGHLPRSQRREPSATEAIRRAAASPSCWFRSRQPQEATRIVQTAADRRAAAQSREERRKREASDERARQFE